MSIYTESYNSFKRVIYIKASVQEVFGAWTKPNLLSTWFLKRATFYDSKNVLKPENVSFEVGDRYEWVWHAWDSVLEGTITAVQPNSSCKFTFGDAGNVELLFTSTPQDETKIELVQSNIPDESIQNIKHYYLGCQLGWSFWLTNLKSYLEHGILLDDRKRTTEGDSRFDIVNA